MLLGELLINCSVQDQSSVHNIWGSTIVGPFIIFWSLVTFFFSVIIIIIAAIYRTRTIYIQTFGSYCIYSLFELRFHESFLGQ